MGSDERNLEILTIIYVHISGVARGGGRGGGGSPPGASLGGGAGPACLQLRSQVSLAGGGG